MDTKPNPVDPQIVKIIEPEEVMAKSGYSRPHTVHCGPDAIYVSALGSSNGHNGPGGVFTLDHYTFDVIGPWEKERGDQELAYDFWWHITQDVMVSSEWGKPHQFENGVVPEELLGGKYGHRLHFWDLRKRSKVQTVDLGAEQQMALELRPAHDPSRNYGFVGVVLAGAQVLSTTLLQWLTAIVLLGFGVYKIILYYRHPRWVGMRVGMRDLAWWSFLMATAHGAGLMIAPVLLAFTQQHHHGHHGMVMSGGTGGADVTLGIALHTLSMLLVMAAVAWIVYKKLGLSVLRRNWVNFDLIWAVALLVVGSFALVQVAITHLS